ncbi:S46 family peptidase [Nibrella saemangeumensis]|uniref:Dipeptidyl-peptidase n=2 Tax=Nibrella saemangeumensis TaxID=1084526 RepID=A0ABP8MDC4_9BACT
MPDYSYMSQRLIAKTRLTGALLLSLLSIAAQSQQATLNPDTVKAGRFDMGKMWTFDNPPKEYFRQTYNFTPDDKWFEEVRLASLRFADYCSASFVSPNGLVMTNHHCARESGVGVQRKGEDLVNKGFFAKTGAEERKVPGLFVDQLVRIEDITSRVQSAMGTNTAEQAQLQAREQAFDDIKKEYQNREGWKGLELQTITFYNGGRYSLYGFKRYNDVRLVFMPELQLGFFGGDPDNFTYPRYSLDCSFFRVYDNGKPLRTAHYFKFNPNGIRDGEPVFVTGNPGNTERLKTVTELEYDRDFRMPYILQLLRNRSSALQAYNATAKNDSIQNEIFSFENSYKAYSGQLAGLRDPYLLSRKAAFERQFQADARTKNIATDRMAVWQDLSANTGQLRKVFNDNTYLAPNPLAQGEVLAFAYLLAMYGDAINGQPQMADRIRTMLEPPVVKSRSLEEAYLAAHLSEVQTALGINDPYVKAALGGRSPKEAAAYLLSQTKLTNPAFVEELITKGAMTITTSNDPLLEVARQAVKRYQTASGTARQVSTRQEVLRQQLGRLLYDVYGTGFPPDATFSLRINDGVVKGYPYNGTQAPIMTTYAGLYDRYYSFNGKAPWALPDRWKNPPMALLREPMCFISTNDIIGGNSGSPIINKNREAVGLAFDGNMESLPGSFIFVPEVNRCISVHTGGIIAAMRHIYKADRLITELVGTTK